MFIAVEAILVACVGVITGTNTLLYLMGLNALTLGACALFAVQQRFDFTPIFGLMLTALCGLLFVGTLSAILGLSVGSFVWGAVASIVYCVVVMVHSDFTMRAITADSASVPKSAALMGVDTAAAALKLNVDVLAVVPFLYGVMRVCCPARPSKAT
jgi:FtsH-binding integral membrane protein